MAEMPVGARLPRIEDPPLLMGEGRFVADVASGAASLRFVRSPFARGRIDGVRMPEGATVFTSADLSDVRPLRPLLHRDDFVAVDQPVLAVDHVSYVGQPIAVVVAGSMEEAEDAADQVFVDIEVLPAAVDLDDALAEGAPRVHDEAPGNTLIDAGFETDNVATAFEGAALVVDLDIRSRRQSAMPLEARGAHADYDAGTGRVTLTSSIQSPHVNRTIIADLLGMAEADLRIVVPDVGGAFGQKFSLAVEDVVTVWVARKLKHPVAWVEDRRENFMSSFHGRDQRHLVRGAFAEDGELLAIDADIRCNVGAYSCYPVTCGVEPLMALAELPGPYDLREYRVRARAVTTNTCPMAPYRGVSRPVITLTLERLLDVAAHRLNMDPVEIRRRNLIRQFPYTSVTGLEYDEGTYLESLDQAAEAVGLEEFRRVQAAARDEGRYLGIGFSVFGERTGYGTAAFAQRLMDVTPGYETVQVSMDPSGYVEARIGASPHGQGLLTSLAQLIAGELGIGPDMVRVVHGDTDRTPYGWGTFASRSMVMAGGAAKLAVGKLRDKLQAIAAHKLEASPHDIVLVDGRAEVKGTDVAVALQELARAAYHGSHDIGEGLTPGLAFDATYDPGGTFSNACHVAVVEVDPETGGVRLDRFLVVEDAGVLINPMIADGQIHGGVTQGIANALFEEVVYDEGGNILTTSLMDYLPPTVAEISPIEIVHLETISDATITGAKGLGEGGAIGAPAAVLNAVSDALQPLGIEVNEMPATPDRVRTLIRQAKGTGP